MKNLLFLMLCIASIQLTAQQTDFNDYGGFVAGGYDVTTYFDGKPLKGLAKYTLEHGGTVYKFATPTRLERFKKNPEQFIPQYGGWCAYAMGKTGSKVSVNPKTYEIHEGKLYLFYNAYLTNTLKKWRAEDPDELRQQADKNWERVMKY
ncbi:MAG: YHS domain-containing (seleno)protein [Bacteroidota bacterium]